MKLNKDLREFIALLNSTKVKYVLVGGHAVAFHGHPRFTGDIDFLVEVSHDNAAKLERAIAAFGLGSLGLSARDFMEPGVVVQLGRPPNRIDLLTSIDGVSFQEAWENRVTAQFDSLPVAIIGRNELLKNKRATGRAQDKADIEKLGD